MIRVVAPSRLHFGLFHVPPGGEARSDKRAFGGVGLMIDSPGVVVTAKPADSWQFEGSLASRAQEFAMRYTMSLPAAERRPFQVLVERCPAEHTGLGVGTQLGLAVAKALAVAGGQEECSSAELAVRVGRGERSAIGVHGFDLGGLIVEGGKQPGEDISPVVAHVELPHAWRVVLLTPPAPALWHGEPRTRRICRNIGRRLRGTAGTCRFGDPARSPRRRHDRVRRRHPRVQPAGGRTIRRVPGWAVCLVGDCRVNHGRAESRGSRRRAEFMGTDGVRRGPRQ